MKNLANCTPREFLVQTNKIRKSVAEWLTLTKIQEIRKNLPKIEPDATTEERKKAINEQAKKNAMAILDSVLEDHPNETAELLGLLCFVEPEDIDNHKMSEFLGQFSEIISCEEVLSFFISLAQLGNKGIFDTAKG